jgi:hypothetical protein
MHVPGWKPTWWRRAQLVWVVPIYIILFLPVACWIGLRELGNPVTDLPQLVADIWRGA